MKLKLSEYRGEQAEMNIQRLNVRIDQVQQDLLIATKTKISYINLNRKMHLYFHSNKLPE